VKVHGVQSRWRRQGQEKGKKIQRERGETEEEALGSQETANLLLSLIRNKGVRRFLCEKQAGHILL
jgi:hypothetical protein